MKLGEEELLKYACKKFQDERYDEALDAFVLTYSKGYEQEWIIENIYNCYMKGNDETFRKAYERQLTGADIPYEECVLDFIPYRDGEYYIFDKELGVFLGIISVCKLQEGELDAVVEKMEFSAAVIEMKWNLEEEKYALMIAGKRQLYLVCDDMNRSMSFWKIPELERCMKNIKMFSDRYKLQDYFHKNTSVYLPKIIGGKEEVKKELIKIMEQEHQYRLTPEGRNTENVLLTIGIPTYNRGNLVLKRLQNLLQMQFDAEIEIAISKSGMELYQEEYKTISRMQDARINYYDHGRSLKIVENWCYVIEMAHGKYVLMVSDEDDVVLSALEHYLKLLASNSEVNLVRAKTKKFYSAMETKNYKKKGLDAFACAFLWQNYLSGLIFRREDFLEENFLELERFKDNAFYQCYPHEWWCAILNMKGDYIEEPVVLISENDSVLKEEIEEYRKLGLMEEGEGIETSVSLPVYATYEERLNQFRGQIDFLHFMEEKNGDILEKGLEIAIGRTAFLLELARKAGYDCERYIEVVDEYLWICMEGIDGFLLEKRQEAKLLAWAKGCGLQLLKLHDELKLKKCDNQ